MPQAAPVRMTVDQFLEWQLRQERLHELVDGVPVLPLKMMTGATQRHDRVVVNVLANLVNKLRGQPCRPMTDDVAVRIPRAISAGRTSPWTAARAAIAT
jgi:Uma2 family endonuclease